MDDLQVATPRQIVEAWAGSAMYNSKPAEHARTLMAAYPPPDDLVDPIFTTPEGPDREQVWHRARDITSVTAMTDLKGYLHDRGLCLPPEVGAAWSRILERQQWAQEVREEIEASITKAIELATSVFDIYEVVLRDLVDITEAGLLSE